MAEINAYNKESGIILQQKELPKTSISAHQTDSLSHRQPHPSNRSTILSMREQLYNWMKPAGAQEMCWGDIEPHPLKTTQVEQL
jgi:hypothetical protein